MAPVKTTNFDLYDIIVFGDEAEKANVNEVELEGWVRTNRDNGSIGFIEFNDGTYFKNVQLVYLKECKDLAVGTYSKTPVLTSYGYHIVYKIAQKDKPKLEDVKDDVKEVLANKKKEADTNLYYKALIKMREDAGLEFSDTKLADEYKKYMNQYNK